MNTATEHAIHIRFGGRHTRRVIVIGVLATACLLALPGVLLAYGYWGWALLTAAGAVTNAVWLISPGDNALDPTEPSQPTHLNSDRVDRAEPSS